MPSFDVVKFLADLWERGSRLLWALTAAGSVAVVAMGIIAAVAPGAAILNQLPATAVITAILGALAISKSLQDASVRTLSVIPNVGLSFWCNALQADGRQLTQVALYGDVTNISLMPIYLADLRLVSPAGYLTFTKHIIAKRQEEDVYEFDTAVPVQGRTKFLANLFLEGYLGATGEARDIKIVIIDQFGHQHPALFEQVRSFPKPPPRGAKQA